MKIRAVLLNLGLGCFATLASLSSTVALADGLAADISYVFHSTFPSSMHNAAWRLASTFTGGLSDMLYEVRVLQRLPADRIDPQLAQQVKYGPTSYTDHWYTAVQTRLVAEAQAMHQLAPDQPATATFEEIFLKGNFPCQAPSCQSFLLSKIAPLMMPTTLSGGTQDLLTSFVSHLPQAQIYSYVDGAGQPVIDKIKNIYQRRIFVVDCEPNQACTGERTK